MVIRFRFIKPKNLLAERVAFRALNNLFKTDNGARRSSQPSSTIGLTESIVAAAHQWLRARKLTPAL